jgi:hypothetical protein
MATANYGLLGTAAAGGFIASNISVGAFVSNANVTQISGDGMSGVYMGSLSSQGNMVAMQLNSGPYKYQATGRYLNRGGEYVEEEIEIVPYLSGYSKVYYKDPTKCTFGADSAIPAIVGVMPASITELQGNFLFYLDLQISRLTGSNYVDIYSFATTVNQVISWVTTSNTYLAALKNAQAHDIKYYGADNLQTLTTQGFNKYQKGNALALAFFHQGLMVESIRDGYFGTPNAVAASLIKHGLGYINKLSDNLYSFGITIDNIYDSAYTQLITQQLNAIQNATDLDTIQKVMESTIPGMTTPMDYCFIDKSSGITNDSAFATMADVGKDLYAKAPNFSFSRGSSVAALIQNIQSNIPADVENILGDTTILRKDIIANLQSYLPVSQDNNPITVLDVIGTSSGYLDLQLTLVNQGLEQLYATSYGTQIRTALEEISRCAAGVPKNAAEAAVAANYVPIPPAVYGYDSEGVQFVIRASGSTYWQLQLEQKKKDYFNLLNTIVTDTSGNIARIVKQINENYLYVCKRISYEHVNYNKASFVTSKFKDNSIIMSLVAQMPSLGADTNNIGTDALLYGTAQSNSSGNLVKAVLDQSKNNSIFGAANVPVNGSL